MKMKDCKNGCDLQGNRSHDVGGIDAIVENINKNIEVESQEIIICKKALEDNNVYTYEGSHKQILSKMNKRYGSPLKVVTNKDNVIIVEAGQVVINKRAVNSNVKKRYTGTNREILDKINTSTGGKSIIKDGGFINSVLQNGGMILNGVTKLQSLLLSKSNFKNKHQANNWVRSHGFTSKVSDETEKYYRYRVNDPKEFKKFSFRTIILKNSGVKAIIGIYKDVNDKGSDINKKSIRNQINIREKEIEHELKINKGVLDDRIKLQKAIDSDKKLKELKGMLVQKMGKGGNIEPLFDLDFYQVIQSSEHDSDYLYQGIDFDKAKSEYKYASEKDEDTTVILEKYTNKYKFVYELDTENEETIDDYPIEYYYEDSDYYKLVENGLDNDTEILESKELKRIKSKKEIIEEEFSKLHSDFIELFENIYKNKIHLKEYAGFMGRSKYYFLLLDKNNDLIDFDKDNKLLYLEKLDSTFDERIERNFVNVNPENAVICVRISNHNKVYKTYGDACLSIVFDKNSDRTKLQETDIENENILEVTYGIEKYFDNYSISEISDVEYSVDSFIKDLDYNSLIDGRESEEYKKGGEIQTKTEESKKQFMIDFINWYKKNVHEKMNIFISINKSKDCVYLDLFEKIDQNVDAKPYLQYICDLADKYNVNIRLEPVPRYKFFLKNTEKRKKITKDYLIEYYKKFGFMEEGSEMIRESKNTPFTQLCNVFKSEMEREYGFKFIENTDNFNSKYGNGHVEFLIPSDKMEGEILMYFKVLANRSMTDFINTKGDVIVTPVIKCYIDKDYNITFDYSELDKYLQQYGVEKFKDGGEVKKKVSRRNLPLNTTYKIIDSFYTGGLSENPHFCENCGKPIANVGIVENEKGEHFEVGMDCAKTLSGIDDDLKFSDAEDDFKKANQIRQKINKAKKNDSLKINAEITYFEGDVVIEVVNKNNDRYEYRIASEPQDFIEKYMPDVLKMISNKEKLGYKPKYTKIFGFDFSKIQRKGNDFEYSFDNVRFKVYDLEIKADSGSVNSHIAYDVYVDDKLIGSDTTYNQRDLEIEILGILNKYYFEKYSNMQSISQKHNIPESEIKEAKKIESEHIDTLEQVYDHKLTPKEAVDKIVSDHIEESSNYYDSEVGLPAMEEKLDLHKINDNRKIDYAKMKKSILEKLLKKENIDLFDALDLEDFKYLILAEPHNAFEGGLMDKLQVSQKGEAYSMKNKFWITNIDSKLKHFYSKDIFIPNKSTKHEIQFACEWADRNNKKISVDAPDDKIEYYKSFGFKIKEI